MLKEFCSKTEFEKDDFVGLRFEDNHPKVIFPRGYKLSDQDDELRIEIIRLFGAIQRFGGQIEGNRNEDSTGEIFLDFPVNSYQYVIKDFLAYGYYSENEVHYVESQKGKINWKRTIQKEQPQIDNDNVVYLRFVSKVNKTNSNTIIAKIHEYCVYMSFEQLGWLYTESMPKKPSIKYNRKLFLNTLSTELSRTFNDRKKRLFQSMLNIIQYQDDMNNPRTHNALGVSRFEYVWENLIDYVFGEDNKEVFFPRATWNIVRSGDAKIQSSALEPDTVIVYDGKIYVIDAKYYKFGVTGNPAHLPATSSIQKQITYGEYIEQMDIVDRQNIFNAFVMPFEKKSEDDSNFRFVSVGTADWKKYVPETLNYNYVLGILLDTKHLLNTFSKHNESEIEKLSVLIEKSLKEFRNSAESKKQE